MVENGENRFRPLEFIEADGNYLEMVIVFAINPEEAIRRRANREMIERERSLRMVDPLETPIEAISNNGADGVRERRSRGGRHSFKIK